MKKIILASNNNNKIEELKSILIDFEVLSMKDIGFYEEIIEDGKTFEENALIKARRVSEFAKEKGYNYDVVADDSGLCCKALNNAPGIYSARYAGDHNETKNMEKLLKNLEGKDKTACYTCNVVLYHPDGTYTSQEESCKGKIIEEARGTGGFGYDPIFLSTELNQTFGEASNESKRKISHRLRALRKLLNQ